MDSSPPKKIRRRGDVPDGESRPSSSSSCPSETTTASSIAESQLPDSQESAGSITESQLPEEYWQGDQHPPECGCHWCHLLHGNPEWDNAGYLERLEEMWRAEDEEQQRLSLVELNSEQSNPSSSSSSSDHISDSSK